MQSTHWMNIISYTAWKASLNQDRLSQPWLTSCTPAWLWRTFFHMFMNVVGLCDTCYRSILKHISKSDITSSPETPIRSPQCSLGGGGHPASWALLTLGMPCFQGSPLKHKMAQLCLSSAGHALSERLPHYPATAYVQKKCIHIIHIPWFTRCVLAIPKLTEQKLVQLKLELKWVVNMLPFVGQVAWRLECVCVQQQESVHGCLLLSKVRYFRTCYAWWHVRKSLISFQWNEVVIVCSKGTVRLFLKCII